MSNSVFLDVDPTIVENNLRFAADPEEEKFNKIFNDRCTLPSTLVKPAPGFCIKTKELGTGAKIFINICQTDAIPAPKDITESQLEEILENEDETNFKIPMSIGEVRPETDTKGEQAKACDIAINPKFFEKIQNAPLFRGFFLAVVFEGLKHKHGLHCTDERILKNRKTFGTLQMHRIEQREVAEKMGIKEGGLLPGISGKKDEKSKPIIEVLPSGKNLDVKVPEYKLFRRKDDPQTLYGEFNFPDIISAKQLSLDVGEDRIVLESTNGKYFLDIFIPFFVQQNETSSVFNTATKVLTVTMPIANSA